MYVDRGTNTQTDKIKLVDLNSKWYLFIHLCSIHTQRIQCHYEKEEVEEVEKETNTLTPDHTRYISYT